MTVDTADLGAKLAYNVSDVCKVLSLGRNTVFELIHSGRLAHVRVGRRVIVPRHAVEAFLADGGSK